MHLLGDHRDAVLVAVAFVVLELHRCVTGLQIGGLQCLVDRFTVGSVATGTFDRVTSHQHRGVGLRSVVRGFLAAEGIDQTDEQILVARCFHFGNPSGCGHNKFAGRARAFDEIGQRETGSATGKELRIQTNLFGLTHHGDGILLVADQQNRVWNLGFEAIQDRTEIRQALVVILTGNNIDASSFCLLDRTGLHTFFKRARTGEHRDRFDAGVGEDLIQDFCVFIRRWIDAEDVIQSRFGDAFIRG